MSPPTKTGNLRLGLPKGRMQSGVNALPAEAGIRLMGGERNYRPSLSLEGYEAKVLKPQSIVRMLHAGTRDLGFAGADWVSELGAELVELVDTGLDPVELVAAMPESLLEEGEIPAGPLVVATEYPKLARSWIGERGIEATVLPSPGATEVLPPEDADLIVDNTATGDTLRANDLVIVDRLMSSSTRLYANPRVLEDPVGRSRIETLVMLLESVLEARRRVMLELNVDSDRMEQLVEILPAMRQPTISPLLGNGGFAIKVAVPRTVLPTLIPELRRRGGTDLVVTRLDQIVP